MVKPAEKATDQPRPLGATASSDISEQMLRVFVHTALGASGLTSLISAISHSLMDGVNPIVPAIEFAQFLIELAIWIYAVRTGKYRAAFPMQLVTAYVGMSCVLILGGDNFLSNCFWISLIAPISIAANYRKLGTVLFVGSLVEIIAYYILYADSHNSQTAILTMDAFLFTVAMLCFVLVIKNWYLRLEKRSSEVQAEVARLKDEKLKYLVHLNHEIRNPMAAIVTGIELLHETNGSEHSNTKLASERIDYLVKSLGSTSAHVLSVLNDALELERIESGKDRMAASTFSVRMLMREMEEMQSIPAAALGSSIKVVLAEGLHDQWVGRESRIRQVLLNLTLNALKHANGGMVTLSVWEHDGSLNFSVADTGEGMSERALQHIYEPFSSSMGNDGAIGLGLAICKSIVENQLEGNISVTSVEGEGTTFSFSVPLVKASQVQGVAELIDERGSPRAATGRIDLKTLEGKSVLLVDDNEVNNAMVGMLLGHAGLVVEVARNSQEATGLIRDGKKFDFAVIDQNLGLLSELDGVSLTKSVLSTGVGDVVGLTGNVSTELEEDWLTAGAKKVLYKPVKGKELLSVLISCGAASFAAEPIGQQ